jgi:CheY-like chemotaxis protein
MYPDWSKRSILIADDDTYAHVLLECILKHTGVRIISVYDGTDALSACIEHPELQLIIMDIKMPEMSGVEATRLIRKYRKTLPIVVYSALNYPEYKHLMKKMDCTDFLLKPVKPEIIVDTLSKYLDPHIRVSSSIDIF